jgi:hypothetical protein
MIRASVLLLAAPTLVALVPPAPLSAQSAAQRVSLIASSSALLAARTETDPYTITMAPIAPIAPAPRAAEESGAVGRGFRAAVGIAVGAVVGGWLGYFGAQVTNSDWEKISTAEKTSLRQGYTVAGLGVGGVVGYFLRPKGRVPGRLPQPFNVPARSGRLLLASSELRRSIATNALEAVEMGRPEWTKQQRDDEAKRAGQAGTGTVESTSLVVYVGDEKVGAIETLRDIAIPEVAELRFYDARDARRRWGVEHRYGAIEVVPVSTASESAQPTNAASAK